MSKLTNYKRRENRYKYYSFLNGLPTDHATKWVLDDVRLPAENVKHALRVYRVLTQSKLRFLKVTYDFKYPPSIVRRVLEFERVKENGLTVWQFKLIQDFTVL
jgi:hypothetical protein